MAERPRRFRDGGAPGPVIDHDARRHSAGPA
jgi:hypothetical protein